MSLTAEQKQLLKQTGTVLKDHGNDIIAKFYAALFKDHPEYHNFFNETNQTTKKQPDAMAQTLYTFTQHLDDIDAMKPQMSRLSSKHRAVGVTPDLYPTVGKYLIQAIKDALGDKGTPEVVAAWHALYSLMSQTFIKKEKELYEKLGTDQGFVPFKITSKSTIASGPAYAVTLQRQDGGKPWDHTPGQYITVRIEKNGIKHHGHYPILEPSNGSTYTIAFKLGKETDQNIIVTQEIIQNREVGSTVLVSGPAGSFGLINNAKHHVFIGGGIGITSLLPMINQLLKEGKGNSATVIQCVRTEGHAIFNDKLHTALPQGHYQLLTEKEAISNNHLQGKLNQDTHVYVSGSEDFLALADKALGGANKANVHVKSIEPTLGILKAINAKH